MKYRYLFTFICILIIVILPPYTTADNIEICDGSTYVMNGEYQVRNNVWGASTAQCLEVDTNSTYFKVIHSEHNNTGGVPAAYPFIYKGSHWGGNFTTYNNPLPMQINEIESAPFTWEIGTDDVSGKWNAAFEAWFDETGDGLPYTHELMIWINYAGGPVPSGSYKGKVEISNNQWDVYYDPINTDWDYIAYRINTLTNSVNLDLRDFIHDAVTQDYLNEELYMHNMEAGFEIWIDGQGLINHSFSADIIEGEYVPTAVKTNNIARPAFRLEQNYPNPFNAQTEIHFEIKKNSQIDLSVYDLMGRKVQTLEQGFFTPGNYRTIFDASDLPSGVYYYKLESPFQSLKQKCIYIK